MGTLPSGRSTAAKLLEVGEFEERLKALEETVGQGQSAIRARRR